MTGKIAPKLRAFIARYPSVSECLRLGVVNYAALARLALNSVDQREVNSGVVAIKRLRGSGKGGSHEQRARQLLRRAKVRVSSSISTLNIQKVTAFDFFAFKRRVLREGGDFFFLEGQNHFTIITNEEYAQEIIRGIPSSALLKSTPRLSLVALSFPPIIETTPGVVSYICGLLAVHGINLREEFSCWTDLVIAIDKSQLTKALSILENQE